MDTTKNFFENWIDSQSKMYENWVKQGQETQKNVFGNQAFEKSNEMYNDWWQKQQESLKSFLNNNHGGDGNAQANPFKSYFDQWTNFQKQMADTWTEQGKRISEMYSTAAEGANMYNNFQKLQDNWLTSLRNMTQSFSFPSGNENWKEYTETTLNNTFENLRKGTDSYMRLFELWQPVFKSIQDNTFTVESYKNLLDPAKYKDIIDQMFGFDKLNPMRDLFNQYTRFASQNFGGNNNWSEYADKMKSAFNTFSQTISGNQASVNDWYRQMYQQFNASMSPFFKLVPEGKGKEQALVMKNLFEQYTTASQKLAELQYLVYTTGTKANEEIAKELAARAKEGNNFKDFNEFYTYWTNTNGKVFEDLFATDAFSKLQGELVSLDAQIKKGSNTLMEAWLAPYPVVRHSQLDELYKANYDLKKRVYELEKMVKGFTKQAPAPAAVKKDNSISETKPGAAKTSSTHKK